MNTKKAILKIAAVLAFSVYATTYAHAGSIDYIKNNLDGSQTLTGHVPPEVKNGTAAFKYHASLNLNAKIIMPLRDQSQLSALLQGLYDPKSPDFHHFLTPAQFAQQFSPSTIDSTEVQEFLNKEGIFVTGHSPNGAVLNVTGSVRAFEKTFGLHINYYQKNDGTMFFAPDADPVIPVTLAGKILAVGGLDNLSKYKAHSHQFLNALPKTVGSGPGGYLAPNDVKTAYNLNAVPSTGLGQSVALFELDGYANSDITVYESHFGLASVPLQNVLIDGFSGVPSDTGGASEVTLDIELVAAFAPGSSDIFVYEAPNTTQSWMDEWTQIATDDKAKVISCSWGEAEMDSPTISFDDMVFQQMAAQGQAVFVASGDSGAFDGGGTTLAVDEPAAQPYATAVGISTLMTNSSGAYSSETASVYGGGGISNYQLIPSYQTIAASHANKSAMVSTTMRNLPDVVLTADASTGYAFYIDGSWGGWYGSSIASPIWASFISCVNQGIGANAPIGSANSALYQLSQTSNYADDFHDIITGNNGYPGGIGGYPAEPGFDDATGLGSFNGLNLYNDLVNTYTSAPLTVAITSPVYGSSFLPGSNITINANASDKNGTIAEVLFYNGTTLLGTSSTFPYSFTWTNVPAGNYNLTATVTDTKGVSAMSNSVAIKVHVPPTVSLTSPVNNASYTLPASITLTANASATNATISQVAFYNGTTLIGTAASSPYTITWNDTLSGTYSLTAVATDSTGATATSSPVSISVIASVSIISPANNSILPSNTNMTITATDSQPSGTIKSVSFYIQNTSGGPNVLVGTSTNTASPYSFTVTAANNSPGYLALTARATDIYGVTTSSDPVYIEVKPASLVATITSPANNSTFPAGSNLTITATGSENGGTIEEVAIYNGTTQVGFCFSGSCSVTLSGLPAGTDVFTAVAQDAWGVAATSTPVSVTMTASVAPGITTQPASVTVTVPATATFNVVATGTPTPTYQWMQEAPGAGSFTAISGATNASYTTPATTISGSGTKYECVVTNSAGSVTSNAATLTVTGLPVVSITSPANNSTLPSNTNMTITANASETNGTISSVSFYIQNAYGGPNLLVGTSTTFPYSFTVNAVNNPPGYYALTAKATDIYGGTTISNPVDIETKPASLIATITSPLNNSTLTAGSNLTVTATGSEIGTIEQVVIYNGITQIGECLSNKCSATLSDLSAGTYVFTAAAEDSYGVWATSPAVTVTVKAPVPVVAITGPANNSVFKAGSTVTITATASEINGTIASVSFYNGSTLLGTSRTSPYSHSWKNVAAGTHILTASATDSNGVSTTSSPMTVTVTKK